MKYNSQKLSGTELLDFINESDEDKLPGDQSTVRQDYQGEICYELTEVNDIEKRQSHNHTLFGDSESDVEFLRHK